MLKNLQSSPFYSIASYLSYVAVRIRISVPRVAAHLAATRLSELSPLTLSLTFNPIIFVKYGTVSIHKLSLSEILTIYIVIIGAARETYSSLCKYIIKRKHNNHQHGPVDVQQKKKIKAI
jgi:hypothetical protein